MELIKVDLPETHSILFASDLHLGTVASHVKGFERMLERAKKEKNTYIALGGDMQESIVTDDPRFSGEVHDAKQTPLKQAAFLVDMLKPYNHKIICYLTGNHEYKLYRYGDLAKFVADSIGVPYGAYSAKVSIMNGKKLAYKVFTTHGRMVPSSIADDPVRRLANMRLTIKRRLQHLAGDCAVQIAAHGHRLIKVDPEQELYMTDDGERVHAKYTSGVQHGEFIDPSLRWYGMSGSFLKSQVVGACTYSEQGMYAPVQMGYLQLDVVRGEIKALTEVHVGGDKAK